MPNGLRSRYAKRPILNMCRRSTTPSAPSAAQVCAERRLRKNFRYSWSRFNRCAVCDGLWKALRAAPRAARRAWNRNGLLDRAAVLACGQAAAAEVVRRPVRRPERRLRHVRCVCDRIRAAADPASSSSACSAAAVGERRRSRVEVVREPGPCGRGALMVVAAQLRHGLRVARSKLGQPPLSRLHGSPTASVPPSVAACVLGDEVRCCGRQIFFGAADTVVNKLLYTLSPPAPRAAGADAPLARHAPPLLAPPVGTTAAPARPKNSIS